MGAVIGITAAILVAAIQVWFERRYPCKCGRSRTYWYPVHHERAGVMLGRSLFWSAWYVVIVIGTAASFDFTNALFVVFGVLLPFLNWRRWYLHEKDKLRRLAKRVVGRVVVRDSGRLAVEA